MNLIAEQVDFDYRLYFSLDGKYGTESKEGVINGMIGEVFRHVSRRVTHSPSLSMTNCALSLFSCSPSQKADFAIADLTVTDSRRKFVDFTIPFLENQLSAIIRRDDAEGLRTLEDLVTMNEINRASENGNLQQASSRGVISYGTYRTGSTYFHLSKSRDPVAVRMYNWMLRNQHALVGSAKEGFDRVNAGRYAFIVESTFAEYLTGLYCNLTTLYDTRSLYPRQFAIALPKGSPYLGAFNKAIRELKANGAIEKLRTLYWHNRCHNQKPSESSNKMAPGQHAPPPPVKPVVVPVKAHPVQVGTPRQGNENADDRTSGNRIDPAIEWAGHHRHPTHQRVPPGNTRKGFEFDPDSNFVESRYHHRGHQHAVTSAASTSSSSQFACLSHLLALLLLIAFRCPPFPSTRPFL